MRRTGTSRSSSSDSFSRIEVIGARPVPPASSRIGLTGSRRKNEPIGPVRLRRSPTLAVSVRYSDIRPPRVSFTRKVTMSSLGPEEKE